MTPTDNPPTDNDAAKRGRTPGKRRPHETGGPHDYGGNRDLAGEADAPGDRVQGSDGRPVTGKP